MKKRKELTLQDATKDELIEYFFNPITGHSIYGADKEKFLIWLYRKRTDALINHCETLAEAEKKALDAYIGYVKQANETTDLDEKLKIFDKANKAYKRYEALSKEYEHSDNKLNEIL